MGSTWGGKKLDLVGGRHGRSATPTTGVHARGGGGKNRVADLVGGRHCKGCTRAHALGERETIFFIDA